MTTENTEYPTLEDEMPATLLPRTGPPTHSVLARGVELRFVRQREGLFLFEARLPGRDWYRYEADMDPRAVGQVAGASKAAKSR